MDGNNSTLTRKTLTVSEIAQVLGLGRTSAYTLVQSALDDPEHAPFKAIRLGGRLLVSKQSFAEFCNSMGM